MTATLPRTGLAGVARGGLGNLAGAGFAGLAGLGVTWLAARGLDPARAGVLFTGLAAFGLLAGLSKLGTPTGLVYWIARLRAQGRPDLVRACLRAGIPPVALAAIGLAVLLWTAAPWLGSAISAPSAAGASAVLQADATAALRALAAFLPVAALADAALSATRGFRLMRPTVVLDKLLRPALQLAALAALTLWAVASPATWSLAWALPYVPVLALAAYALAAALRRSLRAEATHLMAKLGSPRPPETQTLPELRGVRTAGGMGAAFWRFTGPRAVASGLQLALQRVDVLLVAWLAGPVPAALYTVAGRFVVVGQLVNQAVGHAVQPRLAERLGTSDVAGVRVLYRTVTGWLVLATWPLYLTVAAHAPAYLGLFGEAYRDAGTVVALLAGAMLLASACGPVDMLLAMAGRTSWNLGNVALALATMVGVAVVLVPRHGALGAAAGLAAGVAVNNLLPLAQVGYALRIHPFGTGTLLAAGLAAGCFGALPALVAATAGTGPVAAAGSLGLATVLYLAGAWRFRRQLALDVLHRRETVATHEPPTAGRGT